MPVSAISTHSYSIYPVRLIFRKNQSQVQQSENGQDPSRNPFGPKLVEEDRVTISDEAKKALNQKDETFSVDKNALPGQKVSGDTRRRVERLKRRDSQVKRHEMAHKMAGGAITGQIVYEYTTGPDGKRYATGGHISIDTSSESTPEATLRKAATVRRAALAPSDPSPADRRVAQKATQMAGKARQEISKEQQQAMAEQMSGLSRSLQGGSGIDVNLAELAGVKLDVDNPFSQGRGKSDQNKNSVSQIQNIISNSFKTQNQIASVYRVNSTEQKEMSQNSQKQRPQDIKISTSVPSKDRLSQTEEEIQEEVVPEVSPIE